MPTEAEWEYAARGGENYIYAGSNDLDEVAWFWEHSGSETHGVGQKLSNGYGLYDMSGNVWEWCWDWYGDYEEQAVIDPLGDDLSSFRVLVQLREGRSGVVPPLARPLLPLPQLGFSYFQDSIDPLIP